MYIRITSRCNMLCPHCCLSCTSDGEDMNFRTFKRSLKLVSKYETIIHIGGGEPTIHPDFFLYIMYCITKRMNIWVATNGKLSRETFMLADLARIGTLTAELSIDEWHEPIKRDVITAFIPNSHNPEDKRKIRSTPFPPIASGRGREIPGAKEGCPCPGYVIEPNGDIKQCGCEDAPIVGNVARPQEFTYEEDKCHKEIL